VKHVLIAATAAMLLSGCSTMAGHNMGMGNHMAAAPMAMPTSAAAYMKMAHSGDMFEVGSSQLALQMSRNPAVRSYAQMMINDHTRMMQAMMAMAPGMSMNMSSMPMMPHHMAMMQRLRTSGGSFDMMYKREQMMAHREALMLHRTYSARGDNPSLRAMAARAVPVVQMHMSRAAALPVRM
jgi:putative membrane protein